MSLPVSRARKVWTMIQVLLGGVFFYTWATIRYALLGENIRLGGASVAVVVVSLLLVCVIEIHLERVL